MKTLATTLGILGLSLAISMSAQDQNVKTPTMTDCLMHNQHIADAHQTMVENQGDRAMGFSHDKTTHHFRLSPGGGTIEVTANDPQDKASISAIHSHLSHIAVLFASGDFSAPMFIHEMIPPGVTTMRLLKATVRYRYEETVSGGRVHVESEDPVGVAAIHDFLRFQIREHQTGDSLEMENAH